MLSLKTAIIQAAPFIILLTGTMLTIFTDTFISKLHKKILLTVILLTITLIIQNCASSLLENAPYVIARKLLSIYGYSVRPAIIVLFFYFVSSKNRIISIRLAWGLVAMNAALYMTALFSPVTFTFKESNFAFARGPLGYTAHIVSGALLLGLLLQAILEYRDNKKELIFPISCISFITGGILIDYFYLIERYSVLSALTISIIISCMFVYFWFHVQFVKSYQENLISQHRIKIMLSQIQPHFLYNTIATIRALCKKDPDKAAQVSERFGQYLRQNLDLLDHKNLIPIENEIEHTKAYAEIEMVRFENIHVEFDIKDTSFYIPPLSVQPMVENAIRHGVRIKEEGIVSVSTRHLENAHEIVIRDNGIGFSEKDITSDGEKHIGIKNVRERIEKLCGGTLTIQSVPGSGTAATILIPEKEEK